MNHQLDNQKCCNLNRQVKLLGAASIILVLSESALSIGMRNPKAINRMVDHFQNGFNAVSQQRYAAGINSLDQAIEIYPYVHALWYHRSNAQACLGDHKGAAESMQKATMIRNGQYWRGDIAQERGTQTEIASKDSVDTQTTLSMLSESAVAVQTEVQVKEAAVQVSSSMSSASAQTDSASISSTFAQTDSSIIGATEIATQTSVAISHQAVQTIPAKISSVFTQTKALESKNTGMQTNYVSIGNTEQQVQTEANDVISQDVQTDDIATNKHYSDSSTSTDDLFVIGADDSHSDILDWEVASHAGSESDGSLYSE